MPEEPKVPAEELPEVESEPNDPEGAARAAARAAEDGKDLAALFIEHDKRLGVLEHDLGVVIHNLRRLEMIAKALVKKVDELDKRGGGGIEVAHKIPKVFQP